MHGIQKVRGSNPLGSTNCPLLHSAYPHNPDWHNAGLFNQGQDFGSRVSGTPSAKYKAYGAVTGPPLSWTVKSTHATSSETITVSKSETSETFRS